MFISIRNSILIEGNLTRDPQLSHTPKGTPVCSFGVASNRFYRQEDELQKEVSFFEIETWARLADACSEHLEKGRGVRVVGRLKQDRWQDQEGNPRSKVKIVAEHVEFKPVFKGKNGDAREDGADDSQSEAAVPDMSETEEDRVLETVKHEKTCMRQGRKNGPVCFTDKAKSIEKLVSVYISSLKKVILRPGTPRSEKGHITRPETALRAQF